MLNRGSQLSGLHAGMVVGELGLSANPIQTVGTAAAVSQFSTAPVTCSRVVVVMV
jgi:hypothetical protein